jgi:Family of unknown function (DUF6252)
MKNHLLMLAIFLFGLTQILSCSKEDEVEISNIFICEINGNYFTAHDSLSFAKVSNESLIIFANDKISLNPNTMTITIPASFKKGKLEIEGSSHRREASYQTANNVYNTFWGRGNGVVEITKHTNNRIKGTFSFDAPSFIDNNNILEVRNGEFDVNIE